MSAFLQPFQSYMSSLQGSGITERSVYVSSADSHIGHELVERLLTGEFRDRFDRITAACVVPNKSKDLANLGARVIPYNYRDPPTLDDGMRGHSILVVIPPAEGGLDEVTRLIIDAGLRNQIPAIVLLSTSAANLGGGKWLPTYSALEEYVQGSSPGQWAIIRAAPLDEDLLLYSRIVQDTGKLALPMGDGAAAFVRLEDYCQYIVRVLSGFGAYGGRDEEERSWKGVHNGGNHEGDWGGEKKPRIHMIDSFFANRVLTVTGPEALTGQALAKMATDATGREITYRNMSRKEQGDVLTANPMLDVSERELMMEVFDEIREGHLGEASRDFAKAMGVDPLGVQGYLRRNAGNFAPQ